MLQLYIQKIKMIYMFKLKYGIIIAMSKKFISENFKYYNNILTILNKYLKR